MGLMRTTRATVLAGFLCIGCSVAAAGVHAARTAGTVECRVIQEFGVALAGVKNPNNPTGQYISNSYATVPAAATVLDKTPQLTDPATGAYPTADAVPSLQGNPPGSERWSV